MYVQIYFFAASVHVLNRFRNQIKVQKSRLIAVRFYNKLLDFLKIVFKDKWCRLPLESYVILNYYFNVACTYSCLCNSKTSFPFFCHVNVNCFKENIIWQVFNYKNNTIGFQN